MTLAPGSRSECAGQVVRVAFGSDRYFQLLREQPELGRYLSLGQYVVV